VPYQVVPIGKSFNDKSRAGLVQAMNEAEREGWRFHSVFGVTESKGCLGSTNVETLYMVLESKAKT
jgi:hypothetical protein